MINLAGLACLTSLELSDFSQLSNNGIRGLAGLAALTNINFEICDQLSDDGFRALAGLAVRKILHLSGIFQL
jgi:hypothetical protein